MNYFIAILIGYLLGSVNPAYICGRLKGFDIRERGSGNAGASNAKVTMGWPYFFLVAIYDITKAMISILVIRYFFPGNPVLETLAGCFAVIGHCYPFYLQFKGGKGFASFIGLTFMLDWKTCVVIVVIALILAFLTNYIVTGTMTLAIGFPIYAYMHMTNQIIFTSILLTCLVIIWKHKVNLYKLLRKEEIGINGKMIGFNVLNKENVNE